MFQYSTQVANPTDSDQVQDKSPDLSTTQALTQLRPLYLYSLGII